MKQYIAILLTLVLTACGGGGGGGSATNAPVSATPAPLAPVAPANNLSQVLDLTGISEIKTMAVGDVTGDGLDDVVIGGWGANGSATYIYVLVQNADGTLTDQTSTILPTRMYGGSQHVFIADFDNDGRNDIFFPGFSDGCNNNTTECAVHSIMFWNQPGQFSQQTFSDLNQAHGACVDDVNGDGKLDMFVAGGYNGSVGGLYVNNGNRTFTLNSSLLYNNTFSTCAVAHNPNGDIAVLLGNNNQVAGYPSNITVFDSQMAFKYNVGVAGRNNATDLIDSAVIDNKFVLVFNEFIASGLGAKELWDARTYSYISTIDNSYNNQYYTSTTNINGVPTMYFSGANDHARLYQYANGTFTPYKQNRFTEMATAGGANPGHIDWSVDTGIVYQNSRSGKVFMLQCLLGVLYTQEL
jgi:hypothetical protein